MTLKAGREEAILDELALRGSVSVAALTERLGVSAMTLRRDLQDLAQRGLLARVHGGAVSPPVAATAPQPRTQTIRSKRPIATIGMIAPSATYYYADVIRGAEERARELGCRLVLAISNYSETNEVRQIERLLASNVDGLLVTPSKPLTAGSATHAALTSAPTPIVVVERSIDADVTCAHLDSVRSDHTLGARLAVQHLASLGHSRIGLAVRDVATARSVQEGYALALSELGLDRTSFCVNLGTDGRLGTGAHPDLIDLLDRCLETNTRAVLVLTDQEAMSLIELATERGVRVPEDLAIVAYDDEVASLADVPLTAIAPAKRELGRIATALCLERIAASKEQRPTVPRRISLVPALHVRGSTVRA